MTKGRWMGAAALCALAAGCGCDEEACEGSRLLVSIELSPSSATLSRGETVALSALGTYDDDSTGSVTDATWESSNQPVATVDAAGVVTAVDVGSAEVTATAEAITSAPAQIEVVVGSPVLAPRRAAPRRAARSGA